MEDRNLFDKEAFAALLDKARGDRSINQFASETDISAAHISRFLRQMIDSPPTPETISKLALEAEGGVTYRDLMIAAGYMSGVSNEEEDSPRNRMKQMREMESRLFHVVLSELYNMSFQWNLQKPENKFRFPDMVLDIDHEGYKKWYIEFKPTLDNTRTILSMRFPHLYGHISMMKLHPTDKFTIVVNNQEDFEQIFKKPPLSLRANLFIMLVDLDKEKIIKEDQLCWFDYFNNN